MVRLGLGVASLVSAEFAGRLAEQVFLTPRRPRLPDVDPALWRRAEPFPIAFGNRLLAGHSWGAGPAVLLVHGWEGSARQLASMIPPLLDGGVRVVAFDAPAHGESPGRQVTLVEVAHAIAATSEAAGGLRGLVAHSFGAAAATVALGFGLPIDRVAYVAPVFAIDRAVRRFASVAGLSPAAETAFRRRLEQRNGVGVERLDGRVLAPMMTAPLVVVHDRLDREVPLAEGKALTQAWKRSTLVETEGLGHRRILRDPGVIRTVTDFLVGSPIFEARPTSQESIERELFDRDARRAPRLPPIPPWAKLDVR